MWAGNVGDCLLDQYLFLESLNSSIYLTFLQEALPEALKSVTMSIHDAFTFNTTKILHISAQMSENNLQSRFVTADQSAWLPRSPASPVDFFLMKIFKRASM